MLANTILYKTLYFLYFIFIFFLSFGSTAVGRSALWCAVAPIVTKGAENLGSAAINGKFCVSGAPSDEHQSHRIVGAVDWHSLYKLYTG